MKKLLTAGIFGTILGIVSAGTANASIVSSGFLDEKLTEYALSTSLDLKANQSDLTALSNKIGTLPSGDSPEFPGYDFLFPWIDQPLPYPTSLEELITAIYGTENGVPGLLAGIIANFRTDINNDGSPDMNVGLVPNFILAKKADDLANANATKIGTLPSGGFPERPELTELLIWAEQEHTYPTSLSELITALYGNPETGKPGLLFGIVGGFETSFGEEIGFGAAKVLANKAQATADANTAKIGTLPTEYATVGAALTAIKGIAEDAKAAALAAIPDPKQEGSSGKFVLTVDIVGDNATYRWEKIDREGETTTTTE